MIKFNTYFKNNKIESFFKIYLKIIKQIIHTYQMSYNQKFIEVLEKLSNIMLKKGEPFRAKAYQKAQEFIMSYPNNITSLSELNGKPGIGPAVLEKLEEFINTGSLQIIEREKNNPVNVLSDVYGIGPKKAQELVEQGITSIEQLRANQHQLLNETQKVGLKYYEDILKRIPRQEIESYNTLFKGIFIKNASSSYEIVGSYRRKANDSGDIDVIITSESPQNFIIFIDTLIKQKIIIEVLSRGPSKCLVIARITPSSIARRVDFLYTSKEEYPFSILYFTGSKIFNTIMRNQALTMGLTMNEHGLYKMENKVKGEKVQYKFESEQDIFNYLNIEYREPWERTDSRAFKEITEKKALPQPEKKKKIIIEEINLSEFTKQFRKNGTNTLNLLSANDFIYILRELTKAYHNQTPLLTDSEYDIIKDYFEIKYPTSYSSWSEEVGAPVEKNKATLPYEMGSMDKIKPDTNALISWTKKFKGPYVLSCKLDGVSGLYSTEGKSSKLYTRGDGKIGQDISYLIPYLNLPKNKNLVIRGEFVISKNVFETKYKNEFANPRNMVAGIINHKTVDKNKINDVHFVAYEVIKPILNPSDQMEFLKNDLKTECVLNRLEKTISNELLSQILIDNRRMYDYEIDGIIVTNNQIYERKSGNPEHAVAFKMVLSEQLAEATVVDVIWSPSKDGYLKPRVQILPISLGGVKIEYATGFNAAFIQNNKIGIGAIIKIVRSGDVIPHILNVTVQAPEAKMPSQSYKWNATNVDIILENMEQDETVREKVVTGFFKGIEVDGLGAGNISRIIEMGYDTVPKIINMTIEDFLKVEGFKSTMANKIHNGIKEKIGSASLITLMSASNLFGRTFGERKIELIMNEYPDILISKETNQEKTKKIQKVKGIAEKSATSFVDSITIFNNFIKECGLENKLHNKPKNVELKIDGPLFNKIIIMTGFRDKNLEDKIKSAGAKIGSSVSKNTHLVIVKHLEEDTSKASDAKKLGVPLITLDEFNNKYF
jgi:NAD-dependent DNA ligase